MRFLGVENKSRRKGQWYLSIIDLELRTEDRTFEFAIGCRAGCATGGEVWGVHQAVLDA